MVTIPSPIDLVSQANRYFKDFRYYDQRIARAKNLIDLTGIVLVDDCLAKCIYPLYDETTYFAELLKTRIPLIQKNLLYWMVGGEIPVFHLPQEAIKEDSSYDDLWRKDDLIAFLVNEIDVLEDCWEPEHSQRFKEKEIEDMFFQYDMVFKYVERYVERNEDTLPCIYIEHFIGAIQETTSNSLIFEGSKALDIAEIKAFLRGHGDGPVKFWESVAHLPDYSGFFPDKRKPRGNNSDRDRRTEKKSVWKPALGY